MTETPTRSAPAFLGCEKCMGYVRRRGHIVEPLMVKTAKKYRVNLRRLAHLFVLGIHQRHLDGQAL